MLLTDRSTVLTFDCWLFIGFWVLVDWVFVKVGAARFLPWVWKIT